MHTDLALKNKKRLEKKIKVYIQLRRLFIKNYIHFNKTYV